MALATDPQRSTIVARPSTAYRSVGLPSAAWVQAFEKERFELGDPEAQAKFEKESNAKSAFTQIIKKGYKTLRLINFFTVGADEVRAGQLLLNTPHAAFRALCGTHSVLE